LLEKRLDRFANFTAREEKIEANDLTYEEILNVSTTSRRVYKLKKIIIMGWAGNVSQDSRDCFHVALAKANKNVSTTINMIVCSLY
jgi:hypothetical protein